jgi:hypothetical protein
MNFLKDNSDKAFCSSDIAKNLQSNGVHPRDIMGTVRKNEKTVYVGVIEPIKVKHRSKKVFF